MIRPRWQSPRFSRSLLWLLAVVALAGCAPASNPVEEAGGELLRGFEPRDGVEEAYAHLHALVLNDPPLIADAAVTLVADPDRETRFAAVYVLSLSADGTDATHVAGLRVALDDRDVPIRAIAAGALVGLGTKAAIPVLIDLLTDESFVPDSVPQLRVGQIAFDGLTAYTGQTFGWPEADTDASRAASAAEWRAWYEDNGADLRWTGERYE